jgi:7,8-dihydropterin-6-yl-methyl-4-(beta-D-ribofuranosyl)aminobenzene 5'-phosphate synthase
MRQFVCVVTGIVALALMAQTALAQTPGVRVTYLYDNTVTQPGTKADWGFACLIESQGHTVLFDTGANPDVLRQNMAALKLDPARIQALVFSHEHSDHTMGIGALPAIPGLPVYAGEHLQLKPPAEEALARIGAKRIAVKAGQPLEVFPGFTVTEEISANGAYEEALVVDTPEGSIVIIGCAHPGVLLMLEQIAKTTKRPIYMVIGGFHLLKTPTDDIKRIVAGFKSLGVQWAGPTHCTGDEAITLFREAYGDHFITGGVGAVVDVPRRPGLPASR